MLKERKAVRGRGALGVVSDGGFSTPQTVAAMLRRRWRWRRIICGAESGEGAGEEGSCVAVVGEKSAVRFWPFDVGMVPLS